jgi:hypothetical protein
VRGVEGRDSSTERASACGDVCNKAGGVGNRAAPLSHPRPGRNAGEIFVVFGTTTTAGPHRGVASFRASALLHGQGRDGGGGPREVDIGVRQGRRREGRGRGVGDGRHYVD